MNVFIPWMSNMSHLKVAIYKQQQQKEEKNPKDGSHEPLSEFPNVSVGQNLGSSQPAQ